jgi:hypothetical protein
VVVPVYVELLVVVVVMELVTVLVVVVVDTGIQGKCMLCTCLDTLQKRLLQDVEPLATAPPLPALRPVPASSFSVRRLTVLSRTRNALLCGPLSQTPTTATSSAVTRPMSQTLRLLRKNCSRTDSRW